MSRPRARACLEHGLKLDLNHLIRMGFIRPNSVQRSRVIRWFDPGRAKEIVGVVTADLQPNPEGCWLNIEIEKVDQRIAVGSSIRNFGGRQWYFECPKTGQRASVLWRLSEAELFVSRVGLGKDVAYLSQSLNWIDRAHSGKAKIKNRLLGELNADEWELPPKPVGMHWSTYKRYVDRFDHYQRLLDQGVGRTLEETEAFLRMNFPTDFDMLKRNIRPGK